MLQLSSKLEKLVDKKLPCIPKVIAFDVYGTLLSSDAGEIGSAADNTKAQKTTLFPDNFSDQLKEIILSDHNKAKKNGIAYPEVDIVSVFMRLLKTNKEIAKQKCIEWEKLVNPAIAMPGALDFINYCKEKQKIIAIVSNAQFYTKKIIEECFNKKLFSKNGLGFSKDLCIWSYKEKIAKPDSAIFEILYKKLDNYNIKRNEILYIGNDALNDCVAAKQRGFTTALFAGDKKSYRPRLDYGIVSLYPPDTVVSSWKSFIGAF